MEKVRKPNRFIEFFKAIVKDESDEMDLSDVKLPKELSDSLKNIGKDFPENTTRRELADKYKITAGKKGINRTETTKPLTKIREGM